MRIRIFTITKENKAVSAAFVFITPLFGFMRFQLLLGNTSLAGHHGQLGRSRLVARHGKEFPSTIVVNKLLIVVIGEWMHLNIYDTKNIFVYTRCVCKTINNKNCNIYVHAHTDVCMQVCSTNKHNTRSLGKKINTI